MKEQISELLDGELTERQQVNALKGICTDPDGFRVWSRYLVAGAVLRGEPVALISDLVDRVSQGLGETEPGRTRFLPGLATVSWRPFAMAASLLLAVAAGFFAVDLVGPGKPTEQITVTHWENAQPELESALNGLLVQHGEFTPASGMNGFMAYAKFVSYDARR